MFLDLVFALALMGWTEAASATEPVAPTLAKAAQVPAEPGWLATVRHHSVKPGPNWALSFREAAPGEVSVRVWWIEGLPVHKGMPSHLISESGIAEEALPDHISARQVELTVADCRALATMTHDLGELTVSHPPGDGPADDRTGYAFVLETPGSDPVDLDRFENSHPLVRWANRAWDELSDCAGVSVPDQRK